MRPELASGLDGLCKKVINGGGSWYEVGLMLQIIAYYNVNRTGITDEQLIALKPEDAERTRAGMALLRKLKLVGYQDEEQAKTAPEPALPSVPLERARELCEK